MREDRFDAIATELSRFQAEVKAVTKGPLAAVLFLTRRAAENELPFPIEKGFV